jgi:hypothetical protein
MIAIKKALLSHKLQSIISFLILTIWSISRISYAFPGTEAKPPLQKTAPQPKGKPSADSQPLPIKKLEDGRVLMGTAIVVDVTKKEVTVRGRMLKDQTLEFLAIARNGGKSYESAIELQTNATSFNLALIMIGLDKSNAVVPKGHFDPNKAQGDPLEIWVEWEDGKETRRVRPEELLYDSKTKANPKFGTWVYTGSTVLSNGKFQAETDGVLIGFVHDPSSIIENSTGAGLNAYGTIKLNPNLKIEPNTAVKLIIKALPKEKENNKDKEKKD